MKAGLMIALGLMIFLAGCASVPSRLEVDAGASFKLQKFNQILDHEAGKNLKPVEGLEQARRAGNVSISEMARRMGTSRMAVHSLLDQAKPTMTIDSVSRAAAALGADLEMKVISRRTPSRDR